MTQNFGNHRHTPVLFIVAFLSAFLSAIFGGIYAVSRVHLSWAVLVLIPSVLVLAIISRRYITKLQDRIITMEMRYRTDKFLSADRQTTLWSLRKPQIIALRFASDAEMPALIDRAAKENLSSTDIKKAVKDWQADFDRT